MCSKFLPVLPHGCQGFDIFATSLGAFRSAEANAVWSRKLGLHVGPLGSDPRFVIIWIHFRQVRRSGIQGRRRRTYLPSGGHCSTTRIPCTWLHSPTYLLRT